MYCERCNLQYPEGLRFCKWCGQTLTKNRRVTSELQSCPTCSAAVQAGMTFCKACGSRLPTEVELRPRTACPRCGTPQDPGSPTCRACGESFLPPGADPRGTKAVGANTGDITRCSACGESLDAGSIFCKACGKRVSQSEPATAIQPSAQLCNACNSFTPLGSTSCRVCGALLIEEGQVEETPASGELRKPEKKSSTLPDLAEHLPQFEQSEPQPVVEEEAGEAVDDEIESGAYTLVLPSDDLEPPAKVPPREAFKTIQTEIPKVDIQKIKTSPETNVLPGVAGSKSEMQAPTAHIKHGRNTSPVEGSTTTENELEAVAPYDDDRTRVMDSSELPGSETIIQEATSDNRAAEAVKDVPPGTREVTRESHHDVETAPFGKGVPVPAAFQPDDYQTGMISNSGDKAVAADAKAGPGYTSVEHAYAAAAPAPGKTESKPVAKILTVVVVLAIFATAGYLAWSYVTGRAPEPPAPEVAQPTAPPVTAPQPPAPPAAPATPVPPEGMLYVAGGNYVIGRDDGDKLESPMHSVQISPFFIDKTEVTNEAYKAFIDATKRPAPATWKDGTYPEGRANWPVTDVSWEDATAYAAWAGKRLPTEEEWEAAARGTDGRVYPWGNEYRTGVANIQTGGITDVGKFQAGASPSGALDMVGNVWEWTATEFDVYPGNTAQPPANLESGKTYRVIRGGAYDGSKLHAASYRGYLISDQPYPKVGFRCAKNIAGQR